MNQGVGGGQANRHGKQGFAGHKPEVMGRGGNLGWRSWGEGWRVGDTALGEGLVGAQEKGIGGLKDGWFWENETVAVVVASRGGLVPSGGEGLAGGRRED